MAKTIRRYVINPSDDETILHLSGPILNVRVESDYITIYAAHDDSFLEGVYIFRIFETGENIPYHFDYVATVVLDNVYHLCSYGEDETYGEDDVAWTPALMNADVAQNATSSEPSNS